MVHPWPPEVVRYQISGLPLAQVAHDWGVVGGVQYVVSELAIGGDVDPPSIEYQAILLLPFLMAQTFASVQFLQFSDD